MLQAAAGAAPAQTVPGTRTAPRSPKGTSAPCLITALRLSPDASRVAVGDRGGSLAVYELRAGRCLARSLTAPADPPTTLQLVLALAIYTRFGVLIESLLPYRKCITSPPLLKTTPIGQQCKQLYMTAFTCTSRTYFRVVKLQGAILRCTALTMLGAWRAGTPLCCAPCTRRWGSTPPRGSPPLPPARPRPPAPAGQQRLQ